MTAHGLKLHRLTLWEMCHRLTPIDGLKNAYIQCELRGQTMGI